MFLMGSSPDHYGEEPSLDGLPTPQVETAICELAAHINAATARWLALIAEYDRRGAHEASGFVSCASWLAWRCSITPRAAREQLRVARALDELPRIASEFRRGALSYSKVRALTRAATPEMEEELLTLAAEATAAQLERILSGYRRALDPDASGPSAFKRTLEGLRGTLDHIAYKRGAKWIWPKEMPTLRAVAEKADGDPAESSAQLITGIVGLFGNSSRAAFDSACLIVNSGSSSRPIWR